MLLDRAHRALAEAEGAVVAARRAGAGGGPRGEQPRRSKVFWRADDLNPTLVAFIELAGGVFTPAPIVA